MYDGIGKSNSLAQTATTVTRSTNVLSKPRVPLHWPENREFRILSIDGGGIKGIFPATVLAELERKYLGDDSIASYFDLIVGTSTGGIIALGLGSGLTAKDLRELYQDRGREIFPPLGKIASFAAIARHMLKYRYDSEILHDILFELLHDKTLAESQNRLCVPSSEAEHGDVYVFKTPHHPDYQLDADEKMLKVALSTSAAPTFFKVLEDNDYQFVDGGIWANNPTMIGLIEALSAFDVRRDRVKILSLGCGSRSFRANKWKIKFGGLLAWWDIIFAAMHLQSVTALGQASLLIGNDRITRIDAPITDRPIGLDDWTRATTELVPAAVNAVHKSGDHLATVFLGSRAKPFRPFTRTNRSTRKSENDETTPTTPERRRTVKHNKYFDDFLKNEVNLNETRLNSLNDKVRAVSEFLSQYLDSHEKVERQGSYALRTIIKPVKNGQEYDADILVFMEYDYSMSPKDYIDELRDCLRRSKVYDEKAKRKTRCVMLDYAGDFHLDIVPCVEKPDGKKYVCNYQTDEFEETDGTGYREWLNDKTRITSGNLKRVTRLLKYLRDHKGNFTTKSILLTTLIGNTVLGEYDAENFKNVADALKTVVNRINEFLQDNPTMPAITNPALPSEDFTRHWDEKKYQHFRKMFDTYNSWINDAYDATEHDDSVKKWRKVLGDKFGELRGNDQNGAATGGLFKTVSSVVVTPRRPYAR